MPRGDGEPSQLGPGQGRRKSVINIYLPGGMSHQESFDPKHRRRSSTAGRWRRSRRSVDGVYFSENLKRTAQIADKITVVRSMTHGEAAHERGTHTMFTGYRPSPAIQYPSMGSVVSHELGERNNLPPYILIPIRSRPTRHGYLGSAFGRFALGSDPAQDSFSVRDLTLPSGIDAQRFAERREMRVRGRRAFQRAGEIRRARRHGFLLPARLRDDQLGAGARGVRHQGGAEKVRDDYGRNAAGQRMLLARRLVEAGCGSCRSPTGSWDHHDNIKRANGTQMPNFDQAFAALIRDLDERGLLDSTLVIVNTEFGRTPKINGTAGRDHWPKVFSIALAGGGLKRGYVSRLVRCDRRRTRRRPLTSRTTRRRFITRSASIRTRR
jgi:hypothetical protein